MTEEPPVSRRSGLSRRSFLQRGAAAAVALPGLTALLDACSSASSSGSTSSALQIATPATPVKWPIYSGNAPIASGLEPEMNATLNLYNYVDYIDPEARKSFEKKYAKYNVKVSVTTYESTDEALAKIRSGTIPLDIELGLSYDQIGKMVQGRLIQPLNHSYIPNHANVWDAFTNPFYDVGWQYTVPYTVYTTGIAWRDDKVSTNIPALPNPYSVLWDTQYARQVSVLDDARTCMGMVLLKNGLDINTHSTKDLALVLQQLKALNAATQPKVNVTDYQDVPTGVVSVCQAWSGDAINMISYMPTGQSPKVLRYWFPPDGKGEVDNDLMVILKSSKAPVMAHLFVNHMLDYNVALKNFGAIGYQPPQTRLNVADLVSSGFIPANLSTAIVQPEWFNVGYRILELPPAVDAEWQAVWQEFKAGAH